MTTSEEKIEIEKLFNCIQNELYYIAYDFFCWEYIRYKFNDINSNKISISKNEKIFRIHILNTLENSFIIGLSGIFDYYEQDSKRVISILELVEYSNDNDFKIDIKNKISFNESINKIKQWRNKFKAHKDKNYTINGNGDFFEELGLKYSDIESLIDFTKELNYTICNYILGTQHIYCKGFEFNNMKEEIKTVIDKKFI